MPSDVTSATAPLLFRQARWKLALLVLAGLGFCAIGLVMAEAARQDTPNDPWPQILIGCFCVVFFGGCTVLGVVGLFRPVTVTLGPQGLEVRTLFETYTRPWSDVSGFRLGAIRNTTMVVFDDARPKRPRLAAMNESLVGSNAALPSALTVSKKELLAAVLDAQDRWGGGRPA